MISRCSLLLHSYLGLGSLALADLLAANTSPENPLAARKPHRRAKAKSVIFVFLEGGVSQMDTFEYKPMLEKYAGRQMPPAEGTTGEIATFSAAPNRIIPPVARFRQHGQSGCWVSDLLPHLAGTVDDLAFLHGIKVANNTGPCFVNSRQAAVPRS